MPSRSLLNRVPFSEAHERALEAWYAGDYRLTLEILATTRPKTGDDVAEVALLRSRALQRAGNHRASLEAARAAGVGIGADALATSLMLQGAALTRLGDYDEATRVLAEAGAVKGAHRTITAEVLMQQAFLAWKRGDVVASRSLAVKAIGRADDIVLARAQELLGYVNASEEKFAEAARSFREALATLSASDHRDELLHLNVLTSAMSYAFERLEVDMVDEMRAALARISWTADLLKGRFHAYDMAGWLALVAGQTEAAWNDFLAAAESTHAESPGRVIALTNFASLYRTVNETFAARRHIERASRIARSIDWATADSEERVDLLLWAAESARLGMPASLDDLKRFDELPRGAGDRAFDHADRRVTAFRLVARGLTVAASDPNRAIKMLDKALKIWLEIGYRYRAATTALDLYRLAENPDYLVIAQHQASVVRKGFLATTIRADRRREERGLGDLTAAERAVLASILDGKSNAAIAQDRGGSLQTVKNQTRRIFQAMKVGSRAELFVVCGSLGITSSSLEDA